MYRFMTEEEIEIGQISDLKMIHLYQLGGSDALAVYYGNNKQINLCAMDTHYKFLLERTLSLYAQCDQKDSIIIDENTRAMFDQAVGDSNHHTSFFNRVGKKYMELEGMTSPKFASNGVLRETLLPMLKYYLQQMYHMWNLPITFEKEPLGWHRNCVLKIRKGEDTLIHPIRMNFSQSNEYKISIGNFLQDLSALDFEISYREDLLLIIFECKELHLFGESHFEMSSQKLRAYTSIKVAGQVVYHQEEPIQTLSGGADALKTNSNLQKMMMDFAYDMTDTVVYALPWGSYCICKAVESSDGTHLRTDYDTIYLDEYRTKVALRQFSHSLIENRTDGLKLRTDGAILRKLYYGEKQTEVETYFMPVGYYSGWDYKEYLQERYFYHELEETK